MSNGTGGWFKGIMVTSPILLAAAATVFLVASSIINPPDPEFVYTPPEDSDQQTGPTKIEISALDIYLDFLQNLEDSNNRYLGNDIRLTGVVATWGLNTDLQPIITMVSDSFGNAKIVCKWFQFFDADGMVINNIIGREIVLLGVCDGLTGGFLYFHNCSSELVPTKVPIELLD